MKVLFIAPTPFFADRGCHTQIYDEVTVLQRLGHEVIVCTYGLGRDVEGVKTVRTINFPWYKKLSAGPSKTKILLLPCMFFTTFKTIMKFKPDVIHSSLHEGALIGWACRIFFRKPRYVFDIQGSLTGESIQHKFIKKGKLAYKLLYWLEKFIVTRQFDIVFNDNMEKEILELGVKKENYKKLRFGVNTDVFYPREVNKELALQCGVDLNRPRILYMGLLEEYQGINVLMDAIEKAVKKVPDLQAVIIGYPNVEKYKEIAKQKNMEKNLLFLGKIDYKKVPDYLTLSPVAIAPKIAKTEGDGKLYNYLAMGMTVVAFERDVALEVMGDAGLYAKFNDADSLAERIVECVQDEALQKKYSVLARERAVSELSLLKYGKELEGVYNSLERKKK